MGKRVYPWWICERHNPQLGVYYIACGQMPKTKAKKRETGCIYGSNVMLPFATEAEYHSRLAELRAAGERVQ